MPFLLVLKRHNRRNARTNRDATGMLIFALPPSTALQRHRQGDFRARFRWIMENRNAVHVHHTQQSRMIHEESLYRADQQPAWSPTSVTYELACSLNTAGNPLQPVHVTHSFDRSHPHLSHDSGARWRRISTHGCCRKVGAPEVSPGEQTLCDCCVERSLGDA